jgi:hypothetical protein
MQHEAEHVQGEATQ